MPAIENRELYQTQLERMYSKLATCSLKCMMTFASWTAFLIGLIVRCNESCELKAGAYPSAHISPLGGSPCRESSEFSGHAGIAMR
jgi:hypothetical protein